jgi:hypothetical protein
MLHNIINHSFRLSNLLKSGLSLVIGLDCATTGNNITKNVRSLTYGDVVTEGLKEEGRKELDKIKAVRDKHGILAGLMQGAASATGVLNSGVNAALGNDERLVGLGLGKKFFAGTWLFGFVWEFIALRIPQ